MTKIFSFLAIILLTFTRAYCFSSPIDSLGIEKKGDKTFILHRVEQGQTMSAILRKYKCSKAEFLEVNPYLKENPKVSYDQIVRVPLVPKATVAKKELPKKVVQTPKEPAIVIQDSTPKKSKVEKQKDKVVIIDADTQKEITEEPISPKASIVSTEPQAAKPKTHKVTLPNETLFGMAHQYHVPASKIMEWNKMKSNFVKLNQVYIVEDPAKFDKKAIAKIEPTATKIVVPKAKKDSALLVKARLKKEADLTKAALAKAKKDTAHVVKFAQKKPKKDTASALAKSATKTAQGPAADAEKVKIIAKTEAKPNTPPAPTYVPNAPGAKKTIEEGVAEIIDAGEKTDKYLALHKSAPVGTLVQVRNEANGLSVWVKVIGKLPESGETIIKLSPKAFEKLQPRDKRIRAEISYVK